MKLSGGSICINVCSQDKRAEEFKFGLLAAGQHQSGWAILSRASLLSSFLGLSKHKLGVKSEKAALEKSLKSLGSQGNTVLGQMLLNLLLKWGRELCFASVTITAGPGHITGFGAAASVSCCQLLPQAHWGTGMSTSSSLRHQRGEVRTM